MRPGVCVRKRFNDGWCLGGAETVLFAYGSSFPYLSTWGELALGQQLAAVI